MDIEIKRCGEKEIDELYQMTYELVEDHNMHELFSMSREKYAELLRDETVFSYVAYVDGKAAGLINFFYNYTTFSGNKILYLEDLYVREQYRRIGIGRRFFELLRQIAKENDCDRIDWKCADFNKGGQSFYNEMKAAAEKDWIHYSIERADF